MAEGFLRAYNALKVRTGLTPTVVTLPSTEFVKAMMGSIAGVGGFIWAYGVLLLPVPQGTHGDQARLWASAGESEQGVMSYVGPSTILLFEPLSLEEVKDLFARIVELHKQSVEG